MDCAENHPIFTPVAVEGCRSVPLPGRGQGCAVVVRIAESPGVCGQKENGTREKLCGVIPFSTELCYTGITFKDRSDLFEDSAEKRYRGDTGRFQSG